LIFGLQVSLLSFLLHIKIFVLTDMSEENISHEADGSRKVVNPVTGTP
jgi:hypothetical protein